MTGVQALVRLIFDQQAADSRAGLRTGTLVSGYQGSPLGGLDQELARQRDRCAEQGIVHVPGLNEELGATAAWGSQLAAGLPGATVEGVRALWYGKAPGLDRAADALRHGNAVGVGRAGGAVAAVGDDPSCKSSTLPSASESLLASLGMPVFFPGSVQEVLDLGAHAYACSRTSGLWCGLKIVTEVADAVAAVQLDPDRVGAGAAEGTHVPDGTLLAPGSVALDRSLHGERLDRALAYAREHDVNRIHPAPGRLGIAAGGTAYALTRRALDILGVDVPVLQLGMIWPLEPEIVHEFARGLDHIVVLEDKRPFVESQMRDVLYGTPDPPHATGKGDPAGVLTTDTIVDLLSPLLGRERPGAPLPVLSPGRSPVELPVRSPFFCSGCPHNSSLPTPDGTLVGAGIGCHTMVVLDPHATGELTGLTQMGGEGAQWIGMSPFTERDHLTQNLGDGTFFHSGSLAIRAAVASGVNITYKLLHNGSVAMTGGQDAQGAMDVPAITRLLALEGVKQMVVTTEDVKRYRKAELAPGTTVRPREDLLAVQEELAAVPGVTVLIHDQACAAQTRRLRKRGKAPEPAQRVVINERVCEGCGDCGAKSGCLSVQPVDTAYGRKTQVHQASCNKDYSCLEGDCPSFLTVIPAAPEKRRPAAPPEPPAVPEPAPLVSADDYCVRMVGVGGTGVVTVNQVLAMAALIDGRHVGGLDQTGLSQKGGPVSSDLRISRDALPGAPQATRGGADLLLAFDLLGAVAEKHLDVCDGVRTAAVVSTSAVPTGRMVVDPSVSYPALDTLLDRLREATHRSRGLAIDAQAISERLWGDHLPANTLLLGAAFQAGLLPVSSEALELALRLNGAAVERNLAAFRWGRAIATGILPGDEEPAPAKPEPLTVEDRVAELTAYQGARYAERYEAAVAAAPAAQRELVARHLFDLMAYKDEYEVARLHLAELRRHAGAEKVWIHLHPPLLRALGLQRKLRFGRWFTPALRALHAGRRLRGTALDPFGYAGVRRTERALIGEYLDLVALAHTAPPALADELCALPELVRGYEEIKLRGVTRFRRRATALTARAERLAAGQVGELTRAV